MNFLDCNVRQEERHDEAVEKIERNHLKKKRKHWNRKMIEELPVLETEVIEPDGVDLSLYRRIGKR